MQLFERLRGGCRVVIAHFRNSYYGNPFAAERAELARRDGLRHHVRRVSEAVDVRVQPPAPPATLEPEAFLAQRELQRRDRGVQLGGQPHRVHPETGQRVMRQAKNRRDVVHDLHPARVKGRRTRRTRNYGHVCSVAASRERGAVTRDPAAKHQDPGHLEMMRRVSTTSCFSWRTRSSGVANLMSGCR